MVKIKSISFSRFRNNDFMQFMTDVNTLIANATAAALNIENVIVPYNAAFEVLNGVFKVKQKSDLTQQIVTVDVNRDRTWSALLMRIRATLMCPVEKEVNAAQLLKDVFDLYGNVRKLSLIEESAALNNLVEDLEKEELAALCVIIGITKWVKLLKEQNAEVQTLMIERRNEGAHRESGDVKAAREAIEPCYEKIVSRVNALVELEMTTPEIDEFITLLNKQIKDFEEMLTSREGKRNSGDNDDNDIEPTLDNEED